MRDRAMVGEARSEASFTYAMCISWRPWSVSQRHYQIVVHYFSPFLCRASLSARKTGKRVGLDFRTASGVMESRVGELSDANHCVMTNYLEASEDQILPVRHDCHTRDPLARDQMRGRAPFPGFGRRICQRGFSRLGARNEERR